MINVLSAAFFWNLGEGFCLGMDAVYLQLPASHDTHALDRALVNKSYRECYGTDSYYILR